MQAGVVCHFGHRARPRRAGRRRPRRRPMRASPPGRFPRWRGALPPAPRLRGRSAAPRCRWGARDCRPMPGASPLSSSPTRRARSGYRCPRRWRFRGHRCHIHRAALPRRARPRRSHSGRRTRTRSARSLARRPAGPRRAAPRSPRARSACRRGRRKAAVRTLPVAGQRRMVPWCGPACAHRPMRRVPCRPCCAGCPGPFPHPRRTRSP